MTKSNGRGAGGKFAAGNPGGPGRPARVIEVDYIRRLSAAVTPDKWQKIIAKVVTLAENGERWAVEFIAARVMGQATLTDVAIRDELQVTSDDEVAALARNETTPALLQWNESTPLATARDIATQRQAD